VTQWERIATAHADSLDLGRQTVEAFLRLQQPAAAVRHADTLEARHGRDADLQRFRFRGYVGMAHWSQAASLADTLDLEDAVFRADSNYASRHIEARRQLGDTVGALELAARAVRRFPQDGRLYLQYVQLVQTEQPAALPRGVLRFPEIPELHLLTAQAARRNGDRSTAIRALRDAIQRDARRVAAYLQLADLYSELSMPDSALAILRRAPRDGESGETVRAYVLARGLLAVRSVADSAPPAHRRGVALLQLADSVASREESRAMVTAALLQLARAHLVAAQHTRGCADVEAAMGVLREVAGVLERGTGPTAGELTAAYEAMRNAGQAAGRVLCGDADRGHSNSGHSNSGHSNDGRSTNGRSTNGRANYGTRV
jgi:tetratricopeptide (TPR) repeat protein